GTALRAVAHAASLPLLGRVAPRTGRYDAGKLADHHPPPLTVPLEHLGRSPAHEETTTVLLERRSGQLAVLPVSDRIGDLDIANDVRLRHLGYSCFRTTATSSVGLGGANIGISNVSFSIVPWNSKGGS